MGNSATLAVPMRRAPGPGGAVHLVQALHRATTEPLHGLLPTRRLSANPHVVAHKTSSDGLEHADHGNWPHPTPPIRAAIHTLGPPSYRCHG